MNVLSHFFTGEILKEEIKTSNQSATSPRFFYYAISMWCVFVGILTLLLLPVFTPIVVVKAIKYLFRFRRNNLTNSPAQQQTL